MKKMTINKEHTSTHNTSAVNRSKIDYLVIHYTAGLKSHAGKGKDVCEMFRTSDRPGSADFVVDEGNVIWQYNPNVFTRRTWHCGGDLQGSNGHKYYKKCTNSNSIGIEMCSDKLKRTSKLYSSDKDWYIHDETWDSAVSAAAILLNKYNIPFSNMIRHYDVTGKECPAFMCGSKKNEYYDNQTGEKIWKKFRSDVKKALDELQGKKDETPKKEKPKKTEVVAEIKKPTTSKRSKKEVVKSLQKALNSDYNTKLSVDGSAGKLTLGAVKAHNIKKGSKGEFVKWLQVTLNELGYRDNEGKKLSEDKSFGVKTLESVKKFQKTNGLTSDGVVGTGSVSKLLSKYK